ncbi:MAG: hypothetical protein WBG92_21790, partial [Thiohalocapsa sp.]
MGSILRLKPLIRVSGAIALLLLIAVTLGAQAQTSGELKASSERVAHDLEDAVAKMQPAVERFGYLGVFGAVSVEGFGVPAPGQTMLMAGALEAARDNLHIVLLC